MGLFKIRKEYERTKNRLRKSKSLTETTRNEEEKKLLALRAEIQKIKAEKKIAENTGELKEKKLKKIFMQKYRDTMLKEKKKIVKKILSRVKSLHHPDTLPSVKDDLENQLEDLYLDYNYVTYFPRSSKYIFVHPQPTDREKTKEKRNNVRNYIMKKVSNNEIEKIHPVIMRQKNLVLKKLQEKSKSKTNPDQAEIVNKNLDLPHNDKENTASKNTTTISEKADPVVSSTSPKQTEPNLSAIAECGIKVTDDQEKKLENRNTLLANDSKPEDAKNSTVKEVPEKREISQSKIPIKQKKLNQQIDSNNSVKTSAIDLQGLNITSKEEDCSNQSIEVSSNAKTEVGESNQKAVVNTNAAVQNEKKKKKSNTKAKATIEKKKEVEKNLPEITQLESEKEIEVQNPGEGIKELQSEKIGKKKAKATAAATVENGIEKEKNPPEIALLENNKEIEVKNSEDGIKELQTEKKGMQNAKATATATVDKSKEKEKNPPETTLLENNKEIEDKNSEEGIKELHSEKKGKKKAKATATVEKKKGKAKNPPEITQLENKKEIDDKNSEKGIKELHSEKKGKKKAKATVTAIVEKKNEEEMNPPEITVPENEKEIVDKNSEEGIKELPTRKTGKKKATSSKKAVKSIKSDSLVPNLGGNEQKSEVNDQQKETKRKKGPETKGPKGGKKKTKL